MIQILKKDGTSLSSGSIQVIDKFGNTRGLQGPPGPSGSTGFYTHTQGVASNTWVIPHNLGFNPAGIVVIDSSVRTIAGGEITYTNINNLTITFANSFSGVAHLS